MSITTDAMQDVLTFWFEELGAEGWFKPPAGLDDKIKERFAGLHLALARGDLEGLRGSARHWLAAIIVLDQFPRNIYRGTPLAFATDGLALRESRLMVAAGLDLQLDLRSRCFSYLPFEHSENIVDQDRSVALFTALGEPDYLSYAQRHRDVILRFGRFPHRNAILGRETTEAELDYLSQPGSGF